MKRFIATMVMGVVVFANGFGSYGSEASATVGARRPKSCARALKVADRSFGLLADAVDDIIDGGDGSFYLDLLDPDGLGLYTARCRANPRTAQVCLDTLDAASEGFDLFASATDALADFDYDTADFYIAQLDSEAYQLLKFKCRAS